MAGRVLVGDDVAINRIILKVKLSGSRYEVGQAGDVASLLRAARTSRPDLIIATQHLPGGGVAALCDGLRADPALRAVPVIAVLPSDHRRDRLAALSSGADEVLARPLDEVALLALVRNLIRSRSATGELLRKQTLARETGFGEAATGFARPARIALVAPSCEEAIIWRAGLSGPGQDAGENLGDAQVDVYSKAGALDAMKAGQAADIYVISTNLQQEGDGLHLASELRSRSETRHAVMVLHNAPGDGKMATLALDMGADAVLNGPLNGAELAIRLRRLAAAKLEDDALRAALDRQLSLAMSDPLTGLHNRRYAQSTLAHIAREAHRRGQSFALMVLDLDRFKQVNDRHGHAVGDAVLIEVAARLKASLREVDLLARLGGEEFLVALPGAGHADAARAAERLRQVIGGYPIRAPSRCIDVMVTASIGVFVHQPDRANLQVNQMIDHADRALYAAKADGRNQINFVKNAA